MKYLSIAASIIACAATARSAALAQGGPIEQCTFTATPCAPLRSGPTEVITVYEQPFLSTVTQSFDCQGCADVTVIPREGCFGVGPEIIATSFFYDNAQSTTTVDVCSPTPY